MRLLIDSLIAAMLLAVLAGVLWLQRDRQQSEQAEQSVAAALNQLSEKTAYHAALQLAMTGQQDVGVAIDCAWFGDVPPRNALLDEDHPWLDLAPPGDRSVHPPDPVATRSSQAGFWYNPATGIFRARVAPQISEAQTLALYNRINASELERFDELPDLDRQPVAYVPAPSRDPHARHHYASVNDRAVTEAHLEPPVFDPVESSAAPLAADAPAVEEPDDAAPINPEPAQRPKLR